MKKIMNRSLKIMLVMLLSFSLMTEVTYAKTSTQKTNLISADNIKSLSVEEAVTYALSHNGDVLKVKFQQDQLNYTLSQTRSGRKQVEEQIELAELAGASVASITQAGGFEGYLLRNKVTEQRLNTQKKILDKVYVMRTELVKLSVENAYYNILIKKIEYDDAQRNLDVVKKQTEAGEIKLKYGTISEMEFKSLEISQNAAELSLVQAEYAYKEAKMDFNEMLGFKFDKELELTSKLEINPRDITINETKTQELRDNNVTYMYAVETYNNAVEDEKYAKAYFGYNTDAYKTYKTKKEDAEITFQNDTNTLERSILSTYNNLDVMKKTVKIMSDKKDLMSLALGIQEIRLKYQTATENDVIQASINYNNAVNEYYEILMNYNMLVRMFELNIIG